MSDITVIIPHDVAAAAQISEVDARIELATALYREGKLSFGRARKFAELDYFEFLEELSLRGIPLNYSVEEAQFDDSTVEKYAN